MKALHKLSLILLSLFIINTFVHAQAPPKNLVYAHENLEFKSLIALGNYNLFHTSDPKKVGNNSIYLLNKENLVTDTLKVYAGGDFLILNDSTFMLSGNKYVQLRIRNDRFKALSGFETKNRFSERVIDPIFQIKGKLFGNLYFEEYDCVTYNTLALSQTQTGAYQVEGIKDYNVHQLDTFLVFGNETVFLKGNQPVSHEEYLETVLDLSEVCDKRLSHPYYSWNQYSLHNNKFFMYEKSQGTLFAFDVEQDFEVIHKVEFPIENKDVEGWKYLFDYNQKKHYAVKRVAQEVENAESKKKKRKRRRKKEPVNYNYILYEIYPEREQLKAIANLGFDPKMVHKGLLYEVTEKNENSIAIYFHPLDPNYKFPKITYLDY